MSHNFRLLAVGVTVVLCVIQAPVRSFTLSRPINFTHEDLEPEESVNLEIRNDVRRPNQIELTKADVFITTSEMYFKDFNVITTAQDLTSDSSIGTKQNVEFSTQNIERIVNKTTIPVKNYENSNSNKNIISTPLWNKYTIKNKKQVNTEVTIGNQTEVMITDETGVPHQDTKSGDIPSLNQIKNFLFPSSFFKVDVENDTTTLEIRNSNSAETTSQATTSKSGSATVESKRGGFLDFSLKSLFDDSTDKKDNSQENNTSKSKGRRLSWRFGSRNRGKEESSSEKSKERTRFRFRNNKDRKPNNNETKESKEEYSREVDSKEDLGKKGTKTIDKDNKSEKNHSEFKHKIKLGDKNDIKNSNSKEILKEQKVYENNDDYISSKNKTTRIEEYSRIELTTSKGTTTDIDIWKKQPEEEGYEKHHRKNNKGNESSNSRENSREYYSKHKERNLKNTTENKDFRSRARNDKDSKIRQNEPQKDENNEANTQDLQNRKEKQSYNNEKSSNKEYDEGFFSKYNAVPTIKSDEEIETEYFNNNNTSSPENMETNIDNQEKNNTEKQVAIEFIKQYLSTIDEEEENETLSSIIEENTTKKSIEVPTEHSSIIKFNNVDTTTRTLGSYDSFNIPNLLISLPAPRHKGGDLKNQVSTESSNTPQEPSSVLSFEDKLNYDRIETTTKLDIIEKQKYVTEIINTTIEPKYVSQNKDVKNTEAIVQKHEDDRREELLKEELINNYEENVARFKEVPITTTQITIPVEIYKIKQKTEDEKLSVKPLSFIDKLKTTILYPIGANYKPLKKIEVQPPKPFVRDPDDNSWRNESLSSLGIVFKPKNSTKPFTQVLKNKTETEWNNILEKQSKNDTPDLRERLEKITELRKSKKKKIDLYGNVVYNDYEESGSKETEESDSSTPAIATTTVSTKTLSFARTSTATAEMEPLLHNSSTEKPKKVSSVSEFYDTSEEDDADYLTLAKIDLKKFTVPINTNAYVTPPTWFVTNHRHENVNNDRKPTLQYFPPLTTQNGMYRDFDTDFHRKMNAYTDTEPPTDVLPVSHAKPSTSVPTDMKEHMFTPISRNYVDRNITTKTLEYEKPSYMTQPPTTPDVKEGYGIVTDDGSFNRAADVIKHYRDFLNAVAKDHQEDNEGYFPYTRPPTHGITASEIFNKIKPKQEMAEQYDYENYFRKDVLQRFVQNFNQNSERFKSDLPVLYNKSIIHGKPDETGDVASSRFFVSRKLSRPAGDCGTIELSPAYELHYYVPEEEEKQQVEPKPATSPYQYRL